MQCRHAGATEARVEDSGGGRGAAESSKRGRAGAKGERVEQRRGSAVLRTSPSLLTQHVEVCAAAACFNVDIRGISIE